MLLITHSVTESGILFVPIWIKRGFHLKKILQKTTISEQKTENFYNTLKSHYKNVRNGHRKCTRVARMYIPSFPVIPPWSFLTAVWVTECWVLWQQSAVSKPAVSDRLLWQCQFKPWQNNEEGLLLAASVCLIFKFTVNKSVNCIGRIIS